MRVERDQQLINITTLKPRAGSIMDQDPVGGTQCQGGQTVTDRLAPCGAALDQANASAPLRIIILCSPLRHHQNRLVDRAMGQKRGDGPGINGAPQQKLQLLRAFPAGSVPASPGDDDCCDGHDQWGTPSAEKKPYSSSRDWISSVAHLLCNEERCQEQNHEP